MNGQDPWTWLAGATSYLEQNPVDLAHLPCVTMQDGSVRNTTSSRCTLRSSSVSTQASDSGDDHGAAAQQHIEIDDELPELI